MKPWMKYGLAGLVGLIVGAAAGGGGSSSDPKTTTVTAAARTVSRTVTAAPDQATLNDLRSKVSDERATLKTTKGGVSTERARLRRLQRSVSTTRATIRANTVPGTGTFLVGSEVKPGTYRAASSPGCYWARLSSLDTSDIVDNDNADGQVVLQILPSDKAFQANGCASFHKIG